MANIFPVPIKGTEFRHKVIAESHFLTIVTEGTCSDFQGGSGASEKRISLSDIPEGQCHC